jgi:hypothetical protein
MVAERNAGRDLGHAILGTLERRVVWPLAQSADQILARGETPVQGGARDTGRPRRCQRTGRGRLLEHPLGGLDDALAVAQRAGTP